MHQTFVSFQEVLDGEKKDEASSADQAGLFI